VACHNAHALLLKLAQVMRSVNDEAWTSESDAVFVSVTLTESSSTCSRLDSILSLPASACPSVAIIRPPTDYRDPVIFSESRKTKHAIIRAMG